MAELMHGAESAPDNIIQFPESPPRLRSDVPPFDPSNPAHLRAWEAVWDFGRQSLKKAGNEAEMSGHRLGNSPAGP